MSSIDNPCPKCLEGVVSFQNEHRGYRPNSLRMDNPISLAPSTIDRTYSCDKCDYTVTRRDTLATS